MSLDEMLTHLDAWDRTADRRMSERRIAALARRELERRMLADRRAEHVAVERSRRGMDIDSASLAPAAAKADAPAVVPPAVVPPAVVPPAGAPRAARDSEVPVPRSTETRADRAPDPRRTRDATSDSVQHPASRHAH
jgi:hypothetical protein